MTQTATRLDLVPDYLNDAESADQEQVSPLKVLDAAASQMPQQTGNLVHAEVYLAPFLGTIRYTFYLIISSLNDYTDPLFYVWTSSPDRGYPVFLLEAGANQEDQRECDSAESLSKQLKRVFGSSWAKSRIRQWIEMAQERGATQ